MASTIAQGASAGATLGTAFGPIGTAVGAVAGGALGAIPALIKTDAEKENAKRLAELKRMQELGILGLTEAEKQSYFKEAQGAAALQMKQAQAQAAGAGAAYGTTGAGADLLKQQAAAQNQAAIEAQIAQNVEAKDLARKRELEDEIQQRQAAASEYKQGRIEALTGIGTEAIGAGAEYKLGKELDIKKANDVTGLSAALQRQKNLNPEDATAFAKFLMQSPESKQLFEDYAGLMK